ncbi:putative spermidine/putrescine transport system ATP-binding protein [Roseomonas rosea]|uniref:Putative spermidine/putrescine transport system ATP-binding protein n=1 Tax=Muricoccus roseus TaxID=198092 RepID=A0A1M6H6C1_9PROT|nr:ABC transporter ATP-binding protein [Roseomonas rosea]SHJ17787.1 putative spermidine/putrescine transport system ATP-binding protein [Roseomonas rosea]
MSDTYLRIEGLTKRFGASTAVQDVNLDVRQGEMLVLLGPSGCGKTTTLRMVAGFVEASEGRILLEGRDYAGLPPYRREMGMVFQSYALFPHMTVAQNVTFGLRMRKLPKAEVEARLAETLEMVKLASMADRYPRQLSGGQQQRVALARALAIRPKVLLLDEPLSNLDANLRQQVAREIRGLQRAAGLTALMVTHDQDEAMMMADRLVVMNEGAVQQVGTQEELYERPANPFVARFIGHSNLIPGELAEGERLMLPGGGAIRLAGGYTATGPCTLAIRPERVRLCGPEDAGARVVATVEDATYVGAHIEVLLVLPDGTRLILHDPTDGGAARRFAAGDRAGIAWDPASERLFDSAGAPLAARTPVPA